MTSVDLGTNTNPESSLPFDYFTNSRQSNTDISFSLTDNSTYDNANDPVYDAAVPETLENPIYVPGYLRTQIGKTVRVEFFIGNQMTDRVGVLLEVGASYILIKELSGAATIMCDLFAIKFVTIINSDGAIIIP